jgi:class 3 adenylate cyclase
VLFADVADFTTIGLTFKMRIGLNSGLVVVGSIGDDPRMDYMAVGDTTVNLFNAS